MKSYSSFRFSSYSWNHHAGKISLRYDLDDDIRFEETILLPEPVTDQRLKAREWQIERLLFALHMIGGISYFKTCLPKTIKVQSGELSRNDVKFWTTVYERGLGEFFYRNNIDFRGLIKFPLGTEEWAKTAHIKLKPMAAIPKPINQQRLLVPIGGGKDSMVTIELLKKSGAHVTLLRMNGDPVIDELAAAAGLPLLTVKRVLPETLFDLNAEGALNGHVPITAYLSILSALIAEVYGFDAVVMSNERSANIGNVVWKGMDINHQWSKSIDFEKALRRYLVETVKTDTEYLSLLRPFSELRIAEIFAEHPQYFELATSCNRNWKIHEDDRDDAKWCCECPKCAFVFAILAAFIAAKDLKKIFGKNLFDDPALVPLYKELLGVENFKPFECVGTPDETKAAFLLARALSPAGKAKKSSEGAMAMFERDVLPTIAHPESLIEQSLRPNRDHCIPSAFASCIAGGNARADH